MKRRLLFISLTLALVAGGLSITGCQVHLGGGHDPQFCRKCHNKHHHGHDGHNNDGDWDDDDRPHNNGPHENHPVNVAPARPMSRIETTTTTMPVVTVAYSVETTANEGEPVTVATTK